MTEDDGDYEVDEEPVGSCEICGTDLYIDDDDDYCQQCLWAVENGGGGEDVGGSGIMPFPLRSGPVTERPDEDDEDEYDDQDPDEE